MSELLARLRENLAVLRGRINAAAQRAGRQGQDVELLPVTKMQDVATTAALAEVGVTAIAENRILDAQRKAAEMGPVAGSFQWQLIGHLQTNKVRKALKLFSSVHSLNSVRLARALEAEMLARRPEEVLPVYLEVNTSLESAKTGADQQVVREILSQLGQCPHLKTVGLMTMGPLSADAEDARPCFRRLRELLAELKSCGELPADCNGLSMGMSGDFEVAVEEGSTLVRIGTAVFS
jgi:PLP dependent protein